MENVIKPTDPNNFVTYDMPVTIGGYIRQLMLVKIPPVAPDGTVLKLKGLYRFLSYQALPGSSSQGLMTPGVAGVQPGLAMPTPYTNACGTCHETAVPGPIAVIHNL